MTRITNHSVKGYADPSDWLIPSEDDAAAIITYINDVMRI